MLGFRVRSSSVSYFLYTTIHYTIPHYSMLYHAILLHYTTLHYDRLHYILFSYYVTRASRALAAPNPKPGIPLAPSRPLKGEPLTAVYYRVQGLGFRDSLRDPQKAKTKDVPVEPRRRQPQRPYVVHYKLKIMKFRCCLLYALLDQKARHAAQTGFRVSGMGRGA